MSAPVQLTIDGREILAALAGRATALSGAQREIVRTLRFGEAGELRSVEAGIIVHAHRHGDAGELHARRAARWRERATPRALGCCEHAAKDGRDAMVRLERRGIVKRVGRGRWSAG